MLRPRSAPLHEHTAVSAELPGLNGDGQHVYHYRLVLKNEAGAVTFGQDHAFIPTYVKSLQTQPPENITRTQATLKGIYEDTGKKPNTSSNGAPAACPCANQSPEEKRRARISATWPLPTAS